MKKSVSVVIGLNYGDEGKGLTTDYLASKSSHSTAVVRFNGGAQAGHTVELSNGQRHVFHHFGAGSFSGAATILSNFFVVNPNLFFKEANDWHALSVQEKVPLLDVYIDGDCCITTPYDVYINQALETFRGDKRHGSCGVGFGETLERESRGFCLSVKDICTSHFLEKLNRIKNDWFIGRLTELGLPLDHNLTDLVFETFAFNANQLIKAATVISTHDALLKFDNLIFEGAQGLRLDQFSEDFPNVTRSSTGLSNVACLLKNIPCDITVYYITRAYMTRHGAGVLKNEIPKPPLVIDKTNVPNDYQGTMRFALLDFESIAKNVQKDANFLSSMGFATVGVITCCDQIDADTVPDIIECLSNSLKTYKIITSWGPTRETIVSTVLADFNGALC